MLVIIGNKSGQLANRLFAFSHFIANAVEHGYQLFNPSFDEYGAYFNATRHNDFSGYPISVLPPGVGARACILLAVLRRLLPKSPWHCCHMLRDGSEMDLNGADFTSMRETCRRLIVYGWAYRDNLNLRKHAPLLRGFFHPAPVHSNSIDRHFETISDHQCLLVGVHVRRGDYRQWRDGAYYFDDRVYADKMAQIDQHNRSKGIRTRFLLCSNEIVDLGHYQGLDVVTGTGHELEDLYLLAKCDLLVGPPSTYSMWASFFGGVPLYFIRHSNDLIDMSAFEAF